jgi:hypothetical protein
LACYIRVGSFRMTREFALTALFAVTLATASACKKTPEPTGSSGPNLLAVGSAAKPQPSPALAPSALPLGITWEDPPDWPREARQRPMRKATYKVPRAKGDGDDGELAVFYFGAGQGGGLEDNVQRWVKQFSERKPEEPRRADRSANGLKQHTVEIDEGVYDPGMMGGGQKPTPKTGFALLGAIVEAPSGSYFFKLTGPKATVQGAKTKFYALLDSIKSG